MTSLTDAWLECREDSLRSADIAACMMEKHPDVVDAWLKSTALTRLTQWVSDQERDQRHRSVRRFTDAADQLKETGDTETFLSVFKMRAPFIDKMQGELRRPDILDIIAGYKDTRDRADFHARVWRKIHRRIGLGRVDDVYTEEEFEAMFGLDNEQTRSAV